jgi:hypothetical protein
LQESRTDAVLKALESTANEFGSSSIPKVSYETGIPQSSVQRILHKQLHLYPYKIMLLQELTEQDKVNRLEFATWMLNNPSSISHILWSDEADFHLDGDINRHNCRIWSTVKPREVLSSSLHPLKLCLVLGNAKSTRFPPEQTSKSGGPESKNR